MPTPEKHARLGPSSADRWLHCTPSVRLAETTTQEPSEYAEAGRVAHAIAELKARKQFVEPMSPRTLNARLKKLQEDLHYDKEMLPGADLYLDTLKEHAMTFSSPPFVTLESWVPLTSYTPEPDGGGTADCIMIGDTVLWVHDYKYGKGIPVSAEQNPQMMLYALGALQLYAPIYGSAIQTIRMSIIQPRLNNISDWSISREELEIWGKEVVVPAAAKAWAGEGEPTPDLKEGGGYCRFCGVKSTCRARAENALSLEQFKQSLPPLLSDAEVADALTRSASLISWRNDVADYALKACLEGREIPGYKAVEGRGSRIWKELDRAFETLTGNGVDAALLWERKPVTPPGLEKALGKKAFEEVSKDLVEKQPGKPTLVPKTDPRPPYNAAQIAFGAEGES